MVLGKLLKGPAVAELLHRSRAALGSGAEFAILMDGQVVAATADLAPVPQRGDLRFPLGNDGGMSAEVLVRTGRNSWNGKDTESIVQLFLLALRQMVDSELARRAVVADALEQYRESALLRKATELFNKSLRLDNVSRALLEQCQITASQATLGMVFSRQQNGNGWTMLASFGPTEELGLAGIITSRLCDDILTRGREEIVNDLQADARWGGEVAGLESLICMPLLSPGHWNGALVLAAMEKGATFSSVELKCISTLAVVAATAMANAHHFEEVQAMQEALLQALATAIDSRDPCTAGHSQRVALFAVELAKRVIVSPDRFPDSPFVAEELPELFYAGMLHDVGKIGIRESVLTKATRLPPGQLELVGLRMALWGAMHARPWIDDFRALGGINRANVISGEDAALVERLAEERICIGEQEHPLLSEDEKARLLITRGNLTQEEWREIKNHPHESCRILQHIPFPSGLGRVSAIIRQHHEKIDGSGYPDGAGGDTLILQSRILAIADIYDALTATDRPYKRAMPRDKALIILREEAGQGKIDDRLLELFSEHIEDIEEQVHSSLQERAQGK